ncbi:hypothetical protein GCM10010172_44240 [Paractinoplanes ferrugineus]|uniref:Uncharacterized protein n=1 Tax=Paractinoplanes ferrugineus TaxID=113564 RepID=A0A919J581_9ACTN|nr:hypothetical protein Afe05nite_54220 [Actinoplanes ferrugineus]
MFLAYASNKGRALIDREGYLPQRWNDNPARRAEAGIDEKVKFPTKPAQGLAMSCEFLAQGVFLIHARTGAERPLAGCPAERALGLRRKIFRPAVKGSRR